MKPLIFLSIFILFFSCKSEVKKESITNNIEFKARIGNITDFKTIHFPSKDGLSITADLYLVENPKNFILLCHQAGFSRGEYIETAKRLNKIGYSCMAIDQRSGKVANNIINETAKLAKENNIIVKSYFDVKPDIESAIEYIYKLNDNKQIIIVGSSYSASLSLYLAVENDKIEAVAAFSPGEYLKGVDLTNSIVNLDKPIFVTSSKKEIKQVEGIISKVKSKEIFQFKPIEKGIHGSRMLWKQTKGNQECWDDFTKFLKSIK